MPDRGHGYSTALVQPYSPSQRLGALATGTMLQRLLVLIVPGSIVLIGVLANDWIASVALAILLLGLKYLTRERGPPIVAAVFALQWLQVSAGVIYFALSGRVIAGMETPVYRPMVLVGLASISVLFGGFYLSSHVGRDAASRRRLSLPLPWTANQIAAAYVAAVAASGLLTEFASSAAGLAQAILVFKRVRYALLYVLLIRLLRPTARWSWILAVLVAEVSLGFAGYFADFREPLVIAAIAMVAVMDRKQVKTWIAIGSLAALAISSGLIWTTIKPVIRKHYVVDASGSDRLSTVVDLSRKTFERDPYVWKFASDSLISRVWAVYYPALALARVPSVVPHENGAILKRAIENVIMPRLFFPDKPVLPSESDKVRKYAGIWVGGRETNTSYAFGYVGESYVDFGIPLMFLPILAFGIVLGLGYRFLNAHISNDELRTAVTVVVVWGTLGMYEASWVMSIGPSITVLAIIGGGGILLDRVLPGAASDRALPRGHIRYAPYRPISRPSWSNIV